MSPLLSATGLRKRFGGVVAVDRVDVDVQRGEVVGLLGPNGAGKTTTFAMLCGLVRPDAGTVQLSDRDVTRWPLHHRARAGLAYLPQRPSVFPRLTVAGNLEVALRAARRPVSEVGALLDQAGLAERAQQPAGSLSGGERRRLELVRCVALRPSVVLLDEPFAGVDPAWVRDLQDRIRALAGEGIGVLLTDHAVRETLAVCDRAVVIDAGVVQCRGTPAEVAADPRARARYLGDAFRLDDALAPFTGPPRGL